MKNNLYIILVLLIGACFSCSEKVNETSTEATPMVPKPFEAVTMEQIPVYNFDQLEPLLSLKNDTTYIINFWATWCKPCVEELPYFEELNEYAFGKKMKVILVSLDFKKQFETKLIPFINEHKLRSEVVVLSDPDSNSWIGCIESRFIAILHNHRPMFFTKKVQKNEEIIIPIKFRIFNVIIYGFLHTIFFN